MADDTRWLNDDETQVWLDVWALMTWLPTRLEAQLRSDADLSLPEYHVLSQLSMAPERTMRLSQLGAITNMTLSHLSRVFSRMEKPGWVTRRPDPDDGRYTLGTLTDGGWDKVVASAPGHVEAVRRLVFDSLSADEVAALGTAAARMVEAVNPPESPRG